jgi:dienelactone hydrolase
MSRPAFVRYCVLPCALLLACGLAQARVTAKAINYEQDGQKLQGFLVNDETKPGPRPGVLVVPEWWGVNDYVKSRARQLAEMGYVAFVADMYGNAKVTRDPKEAQALSSAVGGKPGLMAARSKAALEVLKQQPQTDKAHLAAIGFCFGGTTVLQLAYSGEPLDATVTFHGGLAAPTDEQAKNLKTSILVLHGAEDGFTKPETIESLKKTLDANKADWYMVTYAHAVHAFTNPEADSFKIPGIGYNEKAARRSWDEMQAFFKERFASKK